MHAFENKDNNGSNRDDDGFSNNFGGHAIALPN